MFLQLRSASTLGIGLLLLAGCGGGNPSNVTTPGSWRAETSGTQHRLYDVACLSAVRCEAVGENGTIVSTIDGGTTWQGQLNPLSGSSRALYAVACMAPSSCYVIARPDTILVTHDAGATWTVHALAVGVSGTSLTDESCLPNYTPISGRPALCRLGLLDVACVNALVCYVVAPARPAYVTEPETKTPGITPSSVWMTSDGGTTWRSQPLPRGVGCDGDCTEGIYGYPLEWVSCLGSGICRAGGGHVLGCGHCGFAYAVLSTRGPQLPWTCVASTVACAMQAPDAGDCPGSAECYGIQSSNPFGPANVILRSNDAGADWAEVGSDWTSGVLSDIACPSVATCYIAGTHGTVAAVVNGAIVNRERVSTTADLYGIACASVTMCIAVGDGGTIVALDSAGR